MATTQPTATPPAPRPGQRLIPTFNRTKIVATLGPASESYDVISKLIKEGVDVCRLNASHGSHEQLRHLSDTVRAVNDELGTNVGVLLDLQGPKLRVGKLEAPVPIEAGQHISFSSSITVPEGSTLPVDYPTFASDVKPGDLVLVEDGKVELTVLETNGKDTVKLEVINGEQIASRKGINLPFSHVSMPSLTDKDLADLELAIAMEVQWIALSFVRTAEDVKLLKSKLKQAGSAAKVIAKVEKPEALRNIESIIEATDAVMIARGDLGVEIPIEDVPFWQKRIIRLCQAQAKPVIVATQMLESMISHPRPTRAEATDVANAVLDGADCVMCSGETSIGKYPLQVVATMQKIIARAEGQDQVYHGYTDAEPTSTTFYSDALLKTAVQFSEEIEAKAIVSMTRSGYTAFQMSRHRPHAHLFIFTDNKPLLSTLNLVWGVRAFYYQGFEGTNETIADVISILKGKQLLSPGDVVINTASIPMSERGRTNMLKFTVVG